MNVPANLKYTPQHEWIEAAGADVRIGITDYAQNALGDIVHVLLPAVGTLLVFGQTFGEIESTKSVSDLIAAATGVVSAVNPAVVADPALVNSSPYTEGWLIEVTPEGGAAAALANPALLTPEAYTALIAGL